MRHHPDGSRRHSTPGPGSEGKLFFIPSSIRVGEIARVLREGYDVSLLNDGFHDLIRELKLGVLMIDTHPGLNEETLLAIAISHVLAVIVRPDQQDYQGTGVTVEVAGVLPHSAEMMALASAGNFVLRCPDHPMTGALQQVAAALIA